MGVAFRFLPLIYVGTLFLSFFSPCFMHSKRGSKIPVWGGDQSRRIDTPNTSSSSANRFGVATACRDVSSRIQWKNKSRNFFPVTRRRRTLYLSCVFLLFRFDVVEWWLERAPAVVDTLRFSVGIFLLLPDRALLDGDFFLSLRPGILLTVFDLVGVGRSMQPAELFFRVNRQLARSC